MRKLKPSALLLLLLFFSLIFNVEVPAQADIGRRTTAITYPLNERVDIQFRGTTRFPRMSGRAIVRRTARNGTEITVLVSKMPRPFELGRGYATYVLWAISPEGQVDNLGEIKRRGFFEFDSKIDVTTRLQTFALIITAEPHFLVKRPSQEIMLENLNPVARSGRQLTTAASVQYFGNTSDYFRDARTPEIAEIDYSRTPSTVLQAKQAIALARFAGAERDAPEQLNEAETLLNNAEEAWRAGRKEDEVDITARRAISTAVNAEQLAYERAEARRQRNEQIRADAEMQRVEDRLARAQDEIADLKRQLADETRSRELSQRDVENYLKQIRDLRAENGKLREDLGRVQLEATNAKARLDAIDLQQREAEQQRQREARLNALQANEGALMQALRRHGTVSKSERGIILTLPESFWSSARSTDFAPGADNRLTAIGQILSENPDYRIEIESHTDNQGTPSELESLTERRSRAIAERLSVFGIPNNRMEPRGLGASIPVAPNNTNANRARNRRVHVIMVPVI
ncbi:MAG: OmpA family protein [Acidobacteria bacterium]|nr:OmpA family protein [Acidobacteriota bacterium]